MCLQWWPDRTMCGSGLLNLKERPQPRGSQRRRSPLEGGHLLSWGGQGQGAHLSCRGHLMHFSTSIYLRAIALLQPSNILPLLAYSCCATATNAAKEATPGLFGTCLLSQEGYGL